MLGFPDVFFEFRIQWKLYSSVLLSKLAESERTKNQTSKWKTSLLCLFGFSKVKYLLSNKKCFSIFHCFNRQFILPENVPSMNCSNYPTKEYKSFADCDSDFLKTLIGKDLKPFWIYQNTSIATSRYKPVENSSNLMIVLGNG